jgi:hypothetical protein
MTQCSAWQTVKKVSPKGYLRGSLRRVANLGRNGTFQALPYFAWLVSGCSQGDPVRGRRAVAIRRRHRKRAELEVAHKIAHRPRNSTR